MINGSEVDVGKRAGLSSPSANKSFLHEETTMFKHLLRDIKSTLNSLQPLIQEIERYKLKEGLEYYAVQMEKGVDLVQKCSKVDPIDLPCSACSLATIPSPMPSMASASFLYSSSSSIVLEKKMFYASPNDGLTPTAIVEGVSATKGLVKRCRTCISAVIHRNQPEISDQETSNSVENVDYSYAARRGPLHSERRGRAVYITDAVTVAYNTGAKSKEHGEEVGGQMAVVLAVSDGLCCSTMECIPSLLVTFSLLIVSRAQLDGAYPLIKQVVDVCGNSLRNEYCL